MNVELSDDEFYLLKHILKSAPDFDLYDMSEIKTIEQILEKIERARYEDRTE